MKVLPVFFLHLIDVDVANMYQQTFLLVKTKERTYCFRN